MQTFYIDVYFLINFTVDILALYFSAVYVKANSTATRLIISSIFGAFLASVIVLISPRGFIFTVILLLGTWLTIEIFANKTSFLRKFKLYMAFFVFETLIGGLVNLIFNLLDIYLYPIMQNEIFGAENRGLLLLALIVLLAYGLLKLMYMLFYTAKSERNIEITVSLNGKEESVTALIDSGCLVCDPLDMKPVIIVKKRALNMISDLNIYTDSNDISLKKRIRIIPIKSLGSERVLIGLRCDYIKIKGRKDKVENIVIAIDEEEGTYGGYTAIAPLSIIQ